jgi:hypothetical protein
MLSFGIPSILFGSLAGVYADRLDRKGIEQDTVLHNKEFVKVHEILAKFASRINDNFRDLQIHAKPNPSNKTITVFFEGMEPRDFTIEIRLPWPRTFEAAAGQAQKARGTVGLHELQEGRSGRTGSSNNSNSAGGNVGANHSDCERKSGDSRELLQLGAGNCELQNGDQCVRGLHV